MPADFSIPEAMFDPACPVNPPSGDDSCQVDPRVECSYRRHCDGSARPLDRLCTCTDGKWSCIQDLGCDVDQPALSSPPPECQGRCSAGATCSYIVEKCPASEDVRAVCGCNDGTWSCSRAHDCYPPSTCREGFDQNCWTNGQVATGPFCPAGTTQAACTAFACQLGGSSRFPCSRISDGHRRSAACVYGHWACPIGYQMPVLIP